MHPDEAAFLQAIIADPECDTPRLVFADWLEEHGRGERAHSIRHQILFQFSDGRKIGHTADVMKETERGPLPPVPLAGLTFRRGFVESVTLSAEDWLAHADVLTACHPLREVRLATWPQVVVTRHGASVCYRFVWRHHLVSRPGIDDDENRKAAILDLLDAYWPCIRTWHLPSTADERATALR